MWHGYTCIHTSPLPLPHLYRHACMHTYTHTHTHTCQTCQWKHTKYTHKRIHLPPSPLTTHYTHTQTHTHIEDLQELKKWYVFLFCTQWWLARERILHLFSSSLISDDLWRSLIFCCCRQRDTRCVSCWSGGGNSGHSECHVWWSVPRAASGWAIHHHLSASGPGHSGSRQTFYTLVSDSECQSYCVQSPWLGTVHHHFWRKRDSIYSE